MIKINNFYDIYIHIAPYRIFEDAVKLLPCYGSLSANFNPKSFNGHSVIRWGGLIDPCMRFAKFILTYINSPSEQIKDYEIVEVVRLFMSKDKYEVSIERNYNKNGKKHKITIKTGAVDKYGRPVYCPIDDMKSIIEKMVYEIGITEAEKLCQNYSRFADVR